jgi:hypothetical protein
MILYIAMAYIIKAVAGCYVYDFMDTHDWSSPCVYLQHRCHGGRDIFCTGRGGLVEGMSVWREMSVEIGTCSGTGI